MEKTSHIETFFSQLLLSVLYALFLLSFSVLFTLYFKPLYYFDVRNLHLEGKSNMDYQEIKQNYDALIRYNAPFYDKPLTLPTLPMSEQGRIHFEDVKRIFNQTFLLCVSTFLLALVGTWKQKNKDYRFLRTASLLTLVVPLFAGLSIAISWENAFVTFHKIFFRNDYWWFDVRTDPIITILPDTFFLHCALLALALASMGSAACYASYLLLSRRKKSASGTASDQSPSD